MNTLPIEWIFEQIDKTAKQLHFLLRHISLYSESPAWIPDSFWDRDESDEKAKLHPPSHWDISCQAFEAAAPEQAPRAKEIRVVLWEQLWNVSSTLRSPFLYNLLLGVFVWSAFVQPNLFSVGFLACLLNSMVEKCDSEKILLLRLQSNVCEQNSQKMFNKNIEIGFQSAVFHLSSSVSAIIVKW